MYEEMEWMEDGFLCTRSEKLFHQNKYVSLVGTHTILGDGLKDIINIERWSNAYSRFLLKSSKGTILSYALFSHISLQITFHFKWLNYTSFEKTTED